MRMKLYGATGKGRLPTLGALFDIKNYPKFNVALHLSRWPVIWWDEKVEACLLYTSPSPRDGLLYRMPSSA